MGRKEGQRTKGNTKPSSSARSAVLLSSTALSHTNVDISSQIFGLTPLSPEEENLIPDELKMVLKKLSKKDVTTKLKALNEFHELCEIPQDGCTESKTSEAGMHLILPYWPRLYSRLSNEEDRRIREATQKAHLVVISRVGREVAPYLKSMASTWHISCCDPHIPASTLALKAFSTAFNGDEIKHREAIFFAQNEVLTNISDNLLVHTPSTLSDPKITSPEDMEAKYLRLLGMSLLGYGKYFELLAKCNEDKIDKLLEKAKTHHSKIFSDSKFWKLAHHNTVSVRQSWYILSGSVAKVIPHLIKHEIISEKYLDKLINNLLGKLDDCEPSILPHIWDAALLLTIHYKEWSRHLDVQTTVLRKVIKLLRSENHMLSGIYPRMLPFCHQIPKNHLKSFYAEILDALRGGLNTFVPSVSYSRQSSHHQNGALMCIQAFFEIVIFGLKMEEDIEIQLMIESKVYEWLNHLLGNSNRKQAECEMVFSRFGKSLELHPAFWDLTNKLIDDWNHFSFDHFLFLYCLTSGGNWAKPNVSTTSKNVKFGSDTKGNVSTEMKPLETWNPKATALLQKSILQCLKLLIDEKTSTTSSSDDDDIKNKLQKHYSYYEFLNEFLKSFPSLIQNCEKGQEIWPFLTELIQVPILSHIPKQFYNQHVALCLQLLSLVPEKHPFYSALTQLDSSEWILAFCRGLVKDHKAQNKECVAFLIASQTFSSKLQEVLLKEDGDGGMTSEEATLLLTSIKYAHELSEERIVEIFTFFIKSSQNNPEVIEEFMTVLSQEECRQYWSNERTRILLQGFLKDIMFQPAGKKSFWQIGLQSLAIYAGHNHLINFLNIELVPKIQEKFQFKEENDKIEEEIINNYDIDNLAMITAYGISLCSENETEIEMCEDFLVSCLSSSSSSNLPSSITLKDLNFSMVTSHLEPRLSCFSDTLEFPTIWSEEKTQYFCRVFQSLDDSFLDAKNLSSKLVKLFSMALTSSVASIITKNRQFSVRRNWNNSSTNQNNENETTLAFVLTKALPKDVQKMIFDQLLMDAKDYGHFWALALSQLENPHLLSKADIESTILSDQCIQPLKSLSILHCLQAINCNDTNLINPVFHWLRSIKDIQENSKSIAYSLSLLVSSKGGGIDSCFYKLLSLLNEWKIQNPSMFLFESAIIEIAWFDVMFASTLADVMTLVLEQLVKNIDKIFENDVNTDLILCSTTSWVQTLDESKLVFQKPELHSKTVLTKCSKFAQSVCALVHQVCRFVSCTTQTKVIEEWQEFFASSIFPVLLSLFVDIATNLQISNEEKEPLLCNLGQVLEFIPMEYLLQNELPAKFFVTDVDAMEGTLPNNLVTILNHLGPMLKSESRSIQLTAFSLLQKIMLEVLKAEEHFLSNSPTSITSSMVSEDDICELPRRLFEIVQEAEPILEVLFSAKMADLTSFGEPLPGALPVPSVVYTTLMSYLLTWKLILTLMSKASAELCSRYSAYLRVKNSLKPLMETLFHVMPMKISDVSNGEPNSDFGEIPELDYLMETNESLVNGLEIHKWSCHVYYMLLSHLPAMVRSWWNLSDKKTANVVEKFTSTNVTPALWNSEVRRIQETKASFDNMTIKVRPTVREVVAIYTIDEGSTEIVIQLPSNFPLGPVSVDSSKRVGVTAAQWRTWILQLTTFLQHQNGSVVDGLSAWKRNVDKRFEGVEECYICFFILHGSTYQMPKVACPTCKKKFHSACLYKWFSTSQNSTCPLCRNLF